MTYTSYILHCCPPRSQVKKNKKKIKVSESVFLHFDDVNPTQKMEWNAGWGGDGDQEAEPEDDGHGETTCQSLNPCCWSTPL